MIPRILVSPKAFRRSDCLRSLPAPYQGDAGAPMKVSQKGVVIRVQFGSRTVRIGPNARVQDAEPAFPGQSDSVS